MPADKIRNQRPFSTEVTTKMDSILFKLVINYYYLWNEAPKFFEKLIFKQKTS